MIKFKKTIKFLNRNIVFLSTILFCSCSSVRNYNSIYKKYPIEKINIESLYNSESIQSNDREVKRTYYNIYGVSDGIAYEENYLKSGLCKYIEGNKTDGFKELDFLKQSEFAIRKEYWPDGNIKHFEKIYYGGIYNSRDDGRQFEIGFPVEISDSYDVTGQLSKSINNEKFFLFTLKDVKKYLKHRGLDFSSEHKSATINRGSYEGKGTWYLSYYDYSQRLTIRIQLSGSDGKELSITKTKMFQGNINDLFPQAPKQNLLN